MYKKIVLNIPHSSLNNISDAKWSDWVTMVKQILKWTDLYTDSLFAPDGQMFDLDRQFEIHKFNHNRFYIDAERLVDDEMEKIGQGIIYTCFEGHNRIVTEEEKEKLMMIYYRYIDSFRETLTISENDTLLIDCHSFPNEKSPDTDFCIGYNEIPFSYPHCGIFSVFFRVFFRQGWVPACKGITVPYRGFRQCKVFPSLSG